MKNLRRRKPPRRQGPASVSETFLNVLLELEQEFEECFEDLVSKVRTVGGKTLGLKDAKAKMVFIDFLKRFRLTYKKEFFADNLTSILLRQLYVQILLLIFIFSLIQRTWRRTWS